MDLHQDEVQALLTNLHSVVRAFVETTSALYKCHTLTSAGESTSTTSCEPPPVKKSKLFGTNTTTMAQSSCTAQSSVSSQMTTYMSVDCTTQHRAVSHHR